MDPSYRARRPALAALAVAALLIVVALASGDRPWTSSSRETRRLPQTFWDGVWTTLFLLWLVAAAVTIRRTHTARVERGPASWKDHVKALAWLLLVGAVAVTLLGSGRLLRHARTAPDTAPAAPGPDSPERDLNRLYRRGALNEPHFSLPAAIAVGAVIAALGATVLIRRRRFRPVDRQAAAAALAQVLDESLDDLRREPDPRRAVIAAYARMEQTLGAYGLGREQAEAPGEYLGRVLPELDASGDSARRLTELFARAKFSPHEVDAAMKDDAIEALVALRDELRAAA